MTKHIVFALLVVLMVGLATAAERESRQEEVKTSAEIQIALPAGSDGQVSVLPGDNRVVVELPRGSVFPLDFFQSSGGLLRGGSVVPLGTDRLRLELELAQGLLDRIDYRPNGMSLVFHSRFDAPRTLTEDSGSYLLGPSDKIAVTVNNQPELTSHLTVTQGGMITAPLVGDVHAEGLSPRQLAVRIAELLGRSYLVDPQVDVMVEDYRSQWVLVSGEVRLPGRLALRGGTRLKEIVADVGGFTPNAGERVTISRRIAGGEGYSTVTIERVAFELGETNPVLLEGDIIDIAPREFCYLQGQVRQPTRIAVERGMTLLRAVSLAGGLTEWADRKEVRILYPEGVEPHERMFNLRKIQEGKAKDPALTGGEIIIVKRRYF